jgi:hypothetical protein
VSKQTGRPVPGDLRSRGQSSHEGNGFAGENLIQAIAENNRLFLVGFPAELRAEDLDVPAGDQCLLYAGLPILHAIIGEIYGHFAHLPPLGGPRRSDENDCCRAIEDPVKLLWALGTGAQLTQKPNGLELAASRASLGATCKRCGVKDPKTALGVLETLGFVLHYYSADGLPCKEGYSRCADIAVSYPEHNDPLLRALVYYTARLPQKKSGRKVKGPILEVLLRADFRPLLPGYAYHEPHLPAMEDEVTRTLDPATLKVWRALTRFMASRHPEYRLFYRVPRIRGRGWVADYSTKDNDYGAWSIFVDQKGLYTRIVFNEKARPYLLEHIGELSPEFQETYLNSVGCKDCTHCGKHVFYEHGDHVHRLCKSPWYFSPYLNLEDLPDIERLVDLRLGGVPSTNEPFLPCTTGAQERVRERRTDVLSRMGPAENRTNVLTSAGI